MELKQILNTVHNLVNTGDRHCYTIVTPNMQHQRMLEENDDFRAAYAKATWAIPDSKYASRLFHGGKPVVPGSDLVPAILESGREMRPFRVFLLGGAPGAAKEAAIRLDDTYRGVTVVGHDCPPMGFEHDQDECTRIVDKINEVDTEILVLGLGAPKQEQWIAAHGHRLNVSVAICAGATIDFLAGAQKRAPWIMRAVNLEFVWRYWNEPRLRPRYHADARFFLRALVGRVWDAPNP